MLSILLSTVLLAITTASTNAEQHTVHFTNNCGFGTPMLIQGPNVLSTGGDVTIGGPLISAIAYLQTGKEHLPSLMMTLALTSAPPPTRPCLFTPSTVLGAKGSCGFNGEGCTLVETTLQNPTTPGSGSSSDISLIPPHAFSVTSGFGYFDGCDGFGADCTSANCATAFHQPNDTFVQVACQQANVNLAITFCD